LNYQGVDFLSTLTHLHVRLVVQVSVTGKILDRQQSHHYLLTAHREENIKGGLQADLCRMRQSSSFPIIEACTSSLLTPCSVCIQGGSDEEPVLRCSEGFTTQEMIGMSL
jgi:hypothetical protein